MIKTRLAGQSEIKKANCFQSLYVGGFCPGSSIGEGAEYVAHLERKAGRDALTFAVCVQLDSGDKKYSFQL